MNDRDKQALLAKYPEAPVWVLNRAWTLKEAIEAMELRRAAFPKTKPKGNSSDQSTSITE